MRGWTSVVSSGGWIPIVGNTGVPLDRAFKTFVTVADLIPPVIVTPGTVLDNATGPGGAVVDFSSAVSATDEVDGPVPVDCKPAPGSTFEIGDTTVTCTATDSSGNSATAAFVVHVRGASELVDEHLEAFLPLVPQAGTSLSDKLDAIQEALANGDAREACEIVAAFDHQVSAQRGKSISDPFADLLLLRTTRIRAVLGC
jgi:HYR domain